KETGTTFLKYLTALRIEEAKRLLSQGDKNVSEVAEMVGYKTSQYFSQIFIKNVGMKPQEYKKWRKDI
ncbi:MAG: helix-turn-helix transcriptional regulator, partial [Bacillota bacterium]|nr:helix-turn-helix transcriptional regulator [Bacillota bacterium]